MARDNGRERYARRGARTAGRGCDRPPVCARTSGCLRDAYSVLVGTQRAFRVGALTSGMSIYNRLRAARVASAPHGTFGLLAMEHRHDHIVDKFRISERLPAITPSAFTASRSADPHP